MGICKNNAARGQGRERVIALAGNPNVGKSTLFNTLTGMRVHTGNWSGKTVECESCAVRHGNLRLRLVDIPGTYSLLCHSEEERIARDYICFGGAELVLVVCDATSLLQNMNLVLQIREAGRRLILCLNFCEEARRRGISIDTELLSRRLGVRVVRVDARSKSSCRALLSEICEMLCGEVSEPPILEYDGRVEEAAGIVYAALPEGGGGGVSRRFAALRALEGDGELLARIIADAPPDARERVREAILRAEGVLFGYGIDAATLRELIVERLINEGEGVLSGAYTEGRSDVSARADKILCGRFTAYPCMLLLLAVVFFITLSLANYPSALLSRAFSFIEGRLVYLCEAWDVRGALTDALIFGVYRTVSEVVAVMLPPMAIFFPLFSLLEDSGYLPRIAYNLDRPFAACGACGKQALTMCMGFGCNAVGITGCRIIDSKRERLLAVLTNSLIPCNGRLPMMLALISVFFTVSLGRAPSVLVALGLTGLIMLSVGVSFLITLLLSRSVLRGAPSSFTIELPPYRRPRILKTLFVSLYDKCLEVLWRALIVSAPMGLVIHLASNIEISGVCLTEYAVRFLNPVARPMGLDGVILLAFILGLPANETVIPIMLMLYAGAGQGELANSGGAADILALSGWGARTAACCTFFSLFHAPCSTSLLTVYKETKSIPYTILSFFIPLAVGIVGSLLINFCFICFGGQ